MSTRGNVTLIMTTKQAYRTESHAGLLWDSQSRGWRSKPVDGGVLRAEG